VRPGEIASARIPNCAETKMVESLEAALGTEGGKYLLSKRFQKHPDFSLAAAVRRIVVQG